MDYNTEDNITQHNKVDAKEEERELPSERNLEEDDFLSGSCPYTGSIEPCENCQ